MKKIKAWMFEPLLELMTWKYNGIDRVTLDGYKKIAAKNKKGGFMKFVPVTITYPAPKNPQRKKQKK